MYVFIRTEIHLNYNILYVEYQGVRIKKSVFLQMFF